MGHVGLRYFLDTQTEMLISIRYVDLKLRGEEINPEYKSHDMVERIIEMNKEVLTVGLRDPGQNFSLTCIAHVYKERTEGVHGKVLSTL